MAIGSDCKDCKMAQKTLRSSLEMCPKHYQELSGLVRQIGSIDDSGGSPDHFDREFTQPGEIERFLFEKV